MLGSIAQRLDRLGLRRPLAAVATLAYRDSRFSVDDKGRWISEQAGTTLVSHTIHTESREAMARRIVDHWLRDYRVKPGDVVFDIGAGVGEEAVVLSPMIDPGGRLVAVEAHPATFACLQETVRRSRLTNVISVACAIGAEEGTVRIGDGDSHIANSVRRDGTIEVVQRTIASLAADYGIERIDFLRMNIEGAERDAVKAMRGVDVRNLCISCHDFCGLPSKAEVVTELESQGFRLSFREAPPSEPWLGDYVYGART